MTSAMHLPRVTRRERNTRIAIFWIALALFLALVVFSVRSARAPLPTGNCARIGGATR